MSHIKTSQSVNEQKQQKQIKDKKIDQENKELSGRFVYNYQHDDKNYYYDDYDNNDSTAHNQCYQYIGHEFNLLSVQEQHNSNYYEEYHPTQQIINRQLQQNTEIVINQANQQHQNKVIHKRKLEQKHSNDQQYQNTQILTQIHPQLFLNSSLNIQMTAQLQQQHITIILSEHDNDNDNHDDNNDNQQSVEQQQQSRQNTIYIKYYNDDEQQQQQQQQKQNIENNEQKQDKYIKKYKNQQKQQQQHQHQNQHQHQSQHQHQVSQYNHSFNNNIDDIITNMDINSLVLAEGRKYTEGLLQQINKQLGQQSVQQKQQQKSQQQVKDGLVENVSQQQSCDNYNYFQQQACLMYNFSQPIPHISIAQQKQEVTQIRIQQQSLIKALNINQQSSQQQPCLHAIHIQMPIQQVKSPQSKDEKVQISDEISAPIQTLIPKQNTIYFSPQQQQQQLSSSQTQSPSSQTSYILFITLMIILLLLLFLLCCLVYVCMVCRIVWEIFTIFGLAAGVIGGLVLQQKMKNNFIVNSNITGKSQCIDHHI